MASIRESSPLLTPLLHTKADAPPSPPPPKHVPFSTLLLLLKFFLQSVMLSASLFLLFELTSPSWYQSNYAVLSIRTMLTSSSLGRIGPRLMFYFIPAMTVAAIAPLYLAIDRKISNPRKNKRPSLMSRLSTYPLLSHSPVGVVSAAEALGWLLLLSLLAWIAWTQLAGRLRRIDANPKKIPYQKLGAVGEHLGFQGLVLLGLLFLPVARSSPLLKLFNLPFEKAVRYHVWIGHLMMVVFTAHGMMFIVMWTQLGQLREKVFEWSRLRVAIVPGEIALLAGWAIWVTAIKPIRVKKFELFFNTHQLYVVFLLGLAMHRGDSDFSVILAAVTLFALDRFLRLIQSRQNVGVLSSSVLPCGTVQLVIPKPRNLHHKSLSFVFIQDPKSSLLQWHPFSIASSSFSSPSSLKVLIKPLGTWSNNLSQKNLLQETIAGEKNSREKSLCPFKYPSRIGVEGPYCHEYEYYLQYSTLILVAGGIGVVPFFAILEEISEKLHRANTKTDDQNRMNLPKEIVFIWSVRHSSELKTTETLSQKTRFLEQSSPSLNLKTLIFVTQETEPDLESCCFETSVVSNGNCYIEPGENGDGEGEGTIGDSGGGERERGGGESRKVSVEKQLNGENCQSSKKLVSGINPIMPLAGTGCPLTSFSLILFSTVGTILSIVICEKYIIYPFDFGTYKFFPFWLRGTLVCLSIFSGVGIFGGVVVLWYYFSARIWKYLGFLSKNVGGNGNLKENNGGGEVREEKEDVISMESGENQGLNGIQKERKETFFRASDVTYGSRPNLSEIFDSVSRTSSEKHLGVLVSGPSGLQETVAKECRKRQGFCTESTAAFHFHSVSFEL